MNLQYISDSSGKTTGVFIPISEWNELKKKYKGIEHEEIALPDWHAKIVKKRLDDHKKNPDSALEFNEVMKEIEKDL